MSGNVQHSGFASRAYGGERRKYTSRYFSRPHSNRYSRSKDTGSSMLAKMGICALMAGLVLMWEFTGGGEKVLQAASGADGGENIGGDYLGKLRFVELPGIIQVFSSEARLRVGVDYTDWHLNEEKTEMTVSGISSALIPAPVDGVIKSKREEDGRTRIELSADGDIVISYSAFSEGIPEEGQPVKAGDTLMKQAESVVIGITKGGRPMDPTDFYDMENKALS